MGIKVHRHLKFTVKQATRPGVHNKVPPALFYSGVIFIDADKPNNPNYLEWALKLGRPGTVIIVDNVVRDGRVVDGHSADTGVQGTRAAFELLRRDGRIDTTALQTVGAKGWDGFILGLVR